MVFVFSQQNLVYMLHPKPLIVEEYVENTVGFDMCTVVQEKGY